MDSQLTSYNNLLIGRLKKQINGGLGLLVVLQNIGQIVIT